MRLVTFSPVEAPLQTRLGALDDAGLLDLSAGPGLPATMIDLLRAGPPARDAVRRALSEGGLRRWTAEQVRLRAPLPRPTSFRDFYAFERHVEVSFANRGKAVPPEWYRFPAFYFSNPAAIVGPGETVAAPPGSQALDFELEVACVIGTGGRDLPAEQAERHIFGLAVMNDWSARDLQREEMRVGLGPAKGKDFATSLGPSLVTLDDLADRATGRPGVYDLAMIARVNGAERSRGNLAEIHFSFGDMIARASAGVDLEPGDLIGSGTVGSGCLLELTGGEGPWLQAGDVVELEIERLGVLQNTVVGGER